MLYHISRSSRAQAGKPAAMRSNEPPVETLVREAAEWRLQQVEEPASGADAELLATAGHNQGLRRLLEGGHERDSRGRTALHLAAAGGQHECVSLLLSRPHEAAATKPNAMVACVDMLGITPLMEACSNGHERCARLLLAAGALVNQRCEVGATALFLACEAGHIDCARLLLQAAALKDIPLSDGSHTTAMIVACDFGHLDIVQALSLHGAKRCPPRFPASAEEVAGLRGHLDVVEWLYHSRNWCTPLHHLELLDTRRALALLRAGAPLNEACAAGGVTPLQRAWQLLLRDDDAAGRGGGGSGSMGRGPGLEAARLVVQAARPWSATTHRTWPDPARARAQQLLWLGAQLANSIGAAAEGASAFSSAPSVGNQAQAIMDVWRDVVMPLALVRADFEHGVTAGAGAFDLMMHSSCDVPSTPRAAARDPVSE